MVGPMAICGLVITLEGDAPQRAATLARLADEPGITVGWPAAEDQEVVAEAARVPAVLESEGKAEYLARWRRVAELSGVAHVDLAYVHYDESDGVDDTGRAGYSDEPISGANGEPGE